MSLRVDLGLVRFSAIEKTYYFYDPQHPTAIQFAINGQWESWDVGWVKHHAHDPDVKRIAADAEAHLLRYSPSYRPWRSTPLPNFVAAHLPPPLDTARPRRITAADPSLSSQELDSPVFTSHSPLYPPTLDSPLSSTHSAAVFSPALRTDSTPRSYGAVGGTPASSCEDQLLELPPIRSPVPGSQLQPSKPSVASTPLSPSAREKSAEPSNGNADPQRKRKAVALSDANDGEVKAPREATDNGNDMGPRTRRRSASHIHCTDTRSDQSLPPLKTNLDMDSRLPVVETSSGHCRIPSINSVRSASPRKAAELVRTAGSALPSEKQAIGPSMPSRHLLQSSALQLHHSRDVKMILSLDGDGIRGLSQAFIVEALVGAICTKVNTNIEPFQIFDLIGGTSMGGLLAIMLSRLRLPAHAARAAYKYVAGEVYQNKKNFFSSCDPHALPPMQDGQGVENAIKTVVAAELPDVDERLYDNRVDSASVFVVSTQVDIGSNRPALLRSYQSRRQVGPEVDDSMTVWEAIKATVAAPRYMEPRNGVNWRPVIEPGLVDHGTSKNNPVRDALFECRKLFSYTNDMIVVVSIGTGSGLDPDRESPEMVQTIRNRTAEAESSNVRFCNENEQLMKRGWMKYFRFNVPNLDHVPLEEWCHEDQIREKTSAYLAEPEVGISFHRCVDEIAAILTAAPRQV